MSIQSPAMKIRKNASVAKNAMKRMSIQRNVFKLKVFCSVQKAKQSRLMPIQMHAMKCAVPPSVARLTFLLTFIGWHAGI